MVSRKTHTNGSPDAAIDWNVVLRQHQRWLRTVVQSRLGEPQAVDEVMQEVALAAVKGQAGLKDPEKTAPWLYQLAVRQTLLYRRKQGRRRKLVDRYAQRFQPNAEDHRHPEPLAWLMGREREQAVRQAMDKLPRRDAEVLMLKYTEGWSYLQLAEHMGISQSAVEARLHRARKKLRAELGRTTIVEIKS
jgi:RNA polymerase sigma-70 factor (ECF subfamily)